MFADVTLDKHDMMEDFQSLPDNAAVVGIAQHDIDSAVIFRFISPVGVLELIQRQTECLRFLIDAGKTVDRCHGTAVDKAADIDLIHLQSYQYRQFPGGCQFLRRVCRRYTRIAQITSAHHRRRGNAFQNLAAGAHNHPFGTACLRHTQRHRTGYIDFH